MTQLSYRKKKDNTPQIIGALLILILFFAYQFHFKNKWFGDKNSSSSSKQIESILSKQENLLTIDEWKKIADYSAQEFFDCTKNLAKDLESSAVYESCYREYNNAWVLFQLGVDEKANLNSEQREQVKTYWNKTEDEMREKVIKLMGENEKKLRPKREN